MCACLFVSILSHTSKRYHVCMCLKRCLNDTLSTFWYKFFLNHWCRSCTLGFSLAHFHNIHTSFTMNHFFWAGKISLKATIRNLFFFQKNKQTTRVVHNSFLLFGHVTYLKTFLSNRRRNFLYSKCDYVICCVAGGGDQPGGLRLSLDPD